MRKSGVLLHITSLPSPGGIGTLGQAAYDFVDFVRSAGMNIWQVLPVGPTGYAESPYQSTSTYAGNPLMIDIPSDSFDEVVQAVRQAKAMIAFNNMRRKAAAKGFMSDEEIEAEIQAARNEG